MAGRVPQLISLLIADHFRSAVTAANTAAMTADNACHLWTTADYRLSAQMAMDGPGRCAHAYGLVLVFPAGTPREGENRVRVARRRRRSPGTLSPRISLAPGS